MAKTWWYKNAAPLWLHVRFASKKHMCKKQSVHFNSMTSVVTVIHIRNVGATTTHCGPFSAGFRHKRCYVAAMALLWRCYAAPPSAECVPYYRTSTYLFLYRAFFYLGVYATALAPPVLLYT